MARKHVDRVGRTGLGENDGATQVGFAAATTPIVNADENVHDAISTLATHVNGMSGAAYQYFALTNAGGGIMALQLKDQDGTNVAAAVEAEIEIWIEGGAGYVFGDATAKIDYIMVVLTGVLGAFPAMATTEYALFTATSTASGAIFLDLKRADKSGFGFDALVKVTAMDVVSKITTETITVVNP